MTWEREKKEVLLCFEAAFVNSNGTAKENNREPQSG
jgi:hypothetical protein